MSPADENDRDPKDRGPHSSDCDREPVPVLDCDREPEPVLDCDREPEPVLEADRVPMPVLEADRVPSPVLDSPDPEGDTDLISSSPPGCAPRAISSARAC